MKRRLAAILTADVVGYSRLMSSDETRTFVSLTSHFDDHIRPAIARHNGRVVKLLGDGLLAEFGSVIEALHAALEIQHGMRERNAGVPDAEAMHFRIGINLGDVIVQDDDLYGDGVNIAARLQAIAEPGGICLSGDAYRQVRKSEGVSFVHLGEHELKNIDEPVAVYQVSSAVEAFTATPTLGVEEVLAGPAVAVLPFQNMSGDPEQEYFSDGLTDDLITALTAWRSFPVIARNSCFVYKNRPLNVKQLARELGARYVVEGGVRKSGIRLRITAQLVDAMTGHHVWAERFDRELEDVFRVQDEISRRIAAVVEPALSRAELEHSRAKRAGNLEAWDYYLRGMALLHQFTKQGVGQAREMFLAATVLDPSYSRAYAGLAWSYSRELLLEYCDDRGDAKAKLLETARRAVALDDLSSLAHHMLSSAYIWRNEHELAIAEGRRAVDLNPSDAEALHALGNKLDLAGDPEGVVRMEQAQQLNPQDPQRHMYLTFLARAYVAAGEYEKALKAAREAVQRRPDYPHAYYILAIALGQCERSIEARAALDECEKVSPGFVASRSGWTPYTIDERNEHLRQGIAKAGMIA